LIFDFSLYYCSFIILFFVHFAAAMLGYRSANGVWAIGCQLFCARSGSISNSRLLQTSVRMYDEEKHARGDGGWFSRLLGVSSSVEPMKAAHSSLLAEKDTVYELQTHDVRPGGLDDYLQAFEENLQLLKKKDVPTELVGSWTVMIGNQDQAVHVWKYPQGFAGVDRTLSAKLNDQALREARREEGKLVTKRKNCVMLAFSFWGDPQPRPPKHIYELRSYTLKAGTMIEWGNNWAKGINHRRDFNQNVAGFFSQIGRLYMVFHFWAYDDLVARKRIREETWRKPGWDTNVAYTVPLIKKMESKLLIPTKFSPLQ